MKATRQSDGGYLLEARAKDWEQAASWIAMLRRNPPHGYKVTLGIVRPRTKDDGTPASGSRCNIEVRLIPRSRGERESAPWEVMEHARSAGVEGIPGS
jgi:hypothetical protein